MTGLRFARRARVAGRSLAVLIGLGLLGTPLPAASWTRVVDTAGHDEARDVAICPDATIVVAGQIAGATSQDIWVQKYTALGRPLWARTFNGAAGGYDAAYGVACGPDGAIYVVGESFTGPNPENMDIWIRKYASGGRAIWTRTVDGPAGLRDVGESVVVSRTATVHVVGRVTTVADGEDIWVRTYSPRGVALWTDQVDGAEHLRDEGLGIAVGPDRAVTVSGFSSTTGEKENIWVRRYAPDGVVLWTFTKDGPASSFDLANAVVVGSDGAAYVSGYVRDLTTGDNLWTARLSAAGTLDWENVYDRSGIGDEGFAVAVDRLGRASAAGVAGSLLEGGNATVRFFSPDGRVTETREYSSPLDGYDAAYGIALRGRIRVAVGTTVSDPANGAAIWIRRLP